jgi:hypothetical protein
MTKAFSPERKADTANAQKPDSRPWLTILDIPSRPFTPDDATSPTWSSLGAAPRLRFTNQEQHAANLFGWPRIFQRTAKYLLTGCLTSGGKRTATRWTRPERR